MLALRTIRQKLAETATFNTMRQFVARPITSNRIGLVGAVAGGSIGAHMSAKDARKKKLDKQLRSTFDKVHLSQPKDAELPLGLTGTTTVGTVTGYIAGQMLCRPLLAAPIIFSAFKYLDLSTQQEKDEPGKFYIDDVELEILKRGIWNG